MAAQKKPKLNAATIVRDRSGRAHVFGPDDTVPEWAWCRIGDHLWAVPPEGADEQHAEDDDPATPEVEKEESDDSAASALTIPPLVGKGSGTDVWRVYALAAAKERGLNIEIPEDAKRGDIVEALTAAGIPTAPEKE